MKYKVPNVTVLKVEEVFTKDYIGGVGTDCQFVSRSLGWYIWLEGSYESLCVGSTKPELQPGDRVNIMIEKV